MAKGDRGRGRPGGPSELLRDQLTTLLENLEKPWYTREAACVEAGIGTTTFYTWMAKGRKAKTGEYREFRDSVRAAEAKAKKAALQAIAAAGVTTSRKKGDWRALAWIAERRWFREFGQKRQTILTGDEKGGPVKHKVEEVVFEPEVPKPRGNRAQRPAEADDGAE